MKILNFQDVTEQLQDYLIPYLESKGIDTNKKFKCLNPKHVDSSPSCGVIKPESKRFNCFSCGTRGDIFDAYNLLEDKPLFGEGFTNVTVVELAEKFNVPLEYKELTEEEIYELDTYRAYKYTADYLTSWKVEDISEVIKTEFGKRKWSDIEKLKKLGVGFITTSYQDYIKHMKELGFTVKFLESVDLDRKDLFDIEKIIFTVKDEAGRPVGFGARNLVIQKPKYINQKVTGVKCNIYQKSKRLYGINEYVRNKETGPLFLVEGYADVISAQLLGFNQVAATCGTSLTDQHLGLLKDLNISSIVLCFDNDQPGIDATNKILEKRLADHKELTVKILSFKGIEESKDLDEYLRNYSLEQFLELKPISAFQWKLNQFEESVDSEEISSTMLPYIVEEVSILAKERMIQELSRATGFSTKVLEGELSRIINVKASNYEATRQRLIDTAVKDLKQYPGQAETILSDVNKKLYSMTLSEKEDAFSVESTLKFVEDSKENEELQDGSIQGFELGQDLIEFQNLVLAGDWSKDVLMFLGGKANAGKSSLCTKLAVSVASIEENNACVIYHTIDDTKEQLLPKFVAICDGTPTLTMNDIKNPNFVTKAEGEEVGKQIKTKREIAYNKILKLIKNGNLVIKDMNDGKSPEYIENLIHYYQELYPNKKIFYILDNFHKMDPGADSRIGYKQLSERIKGIATKAHVPILCTVEYTKLPPGVRPNMDNIAESVSLQYDSNLIMHLWNELDQLGERASEAAYHLAMERSGPIRRPIIEVIVDKNKISSFKSSIFLKFHPPTGNFEAHPLNEALAAQEAVRNNNNRGPVPQVRPLFSN